MLLLLLLLLQLLLLAFVAVAEKCISRTAHYVCCQFDARDFPFGFGFGEGGLGGCEL